jgi:hypothetical protein
MMKNGDLDHLTHDGRRLEDAFFLQRDKALIEKQRAMKEMKATREALAKASGIHNEEVLGKLVELGVRPETLAPLSLIPLVEVAWADGSLSKSEETAVLNAAAGMNIKAESAAYDLLRQWLRNKPSAAMLEAWAHYVQGLCEKLTGEEKTLLKKEIIGQAREVARASGGVLGIGAVSEEEKAALAKLEKAFG